LTERKAELKFFRTTTRRSIHSIFKTYKVFENFDFKGIGVHGDFLSSFKAFDFQGKCLNTFFLFSIISTNIICCLNFEINASLGILKKSWNDCWQELFEIIFQTNGNLRNAIGKGCEGSEAARFPLTKV
jgi:hypothetical protein